MQLWVCGDFIVSADFFSFRCILFVGDGASTSRQRFYTIINRFGSSHPVSLRLPPFSQKRAIYYICLWKRGVEGAAPYKCYNSVCADPLFPPPWAAALPADVQCTPCNIQMQHNIKRYGIKNLPYLLFIYKEIRVSYRKASAILQGWDAGRRRCYTRL